MILIVPDLHIGATWDGFSRDGEIEAFLNGPLDAKVKELGTGLDYIVWLGDIFDTANVSHHAVSKFIDTLYSLSKHGFCKHIIIRGNHDGELQSARGCPLQEIEASGNARVSWAPEIVPNVGVMLPYCSKAEIAEKCTPDFWNMAKGKPAFSHLNIPEALPGIELDLNHGATPSIPPEAKQICSRVYAGHIHKIQIVGNIRILGSVIRMSTSDTDSTKLFMEVDFASGREVAHPIKCWGLHDLQFDLGEPLAEQQLRNLAEQTPYPYETLLAVSCSGSREQLAKCDMRKAYDQLRPKVAHLRDTITVKSEREVRMAAPAATQTNIDVVKSWMETMKADPALLPLAEAIMQEAECQ